MIVYVAQCCGENYDHPIAEIFTRRNAALKFIRRQILEVWGSDKTDTILIERPNYRGIRYIQYNRLYRFINKHFKKYIFLTNRNEDLLKEIKCYSNINRLCQLSNNYWSISQQEIHDEEEYK